jgi:hypothetical protein
MIRFARVALYLAVMVALVGCGPGAGGSAQPAGSTTPATAPAPDDGY